MNVPLTAYYNSYNVCLDDVGLIGSLFAFREGELVQILDSITESMQILGSMIELLNILDNMAKLVQIIGSMIKLIQILENISELVQIFFSTLKLVQISDSIK